MWDCSDEVASDGNYLYNECKCHGTATFTQDFSKLPLVVFTVKVVKLGEGFNVGFKGENDVFGVDKGGLCQNFNPVCSTDTVVTVHIADQTLLVYLDEIPAVTRKLTPDGPLHLTLTLYPGCALLFDMSLSLSHLTRFVSVIRKHGISVTGADSSNSFSLDAISNKMHRESSSGSVLFDRQLSARYYFFQLRIMECGPDSAIGIGVADRNHNTSKFPGWMKRSCGYHSDDGILFRKGQHAQEMPVCTIQDVMGCGIRFCDKDTTVMPLPRDNGQPNRGDKVYVYFTKNGAHVGETLMTVPDGGLYPTIAMKEGDRALVDFAAVTG